MGNGLEAKTGIYPYVHTLEISFEEFKEVTKGMCAQREFDTRENIHPTVYLLEFYGAKEEASPNSMATENVKMFKLWSLSRHGKMVYLGSMGSHYCNEEVIEEAIQNKSFKVTENFSSHPNTTESHKCQTMSTGWEIPQKWNFFFM